MNKLNAVGRTVSFATFLSAMIFYLLGFGGIELQIPETPVRPEGERAFSSVSYAWPVGQPWRSDHPAGRCTTQKGRSGESHPDRDPSAGPIWRDSPGPCQPAGCAFGHGGDAGLASFHPRGWDQIIPRDRLPSMTLSTIRHRMVF